MHMIRNCTLTRACTRRSRCSIAPAWAAGGCSSCCPPWWALQILYHAVEGRLWTLVSLFPFQVTSQLLWFGGRTTRCHMTHIVILQIINSTAGGVVVRGCHWRWKYHCWQQGSRGRQAGSGGGRGVGGTSLMLGCQHTWRAADSYIGANMSQWSKIGTWIGVDSMGDFPQRSGGFRPVPDRLYPVFVMRKINSGKSVLSTT